MRVVVSNSPKPLVDVDVKYLIVDGTSSSGMGMRLSTCKPMTRTIVITHRIDLTIEYDKIFARRPDLRMSCLC